MADRDIGKIFLNFVLSEEVRSFCGGDITNARTEEEWKSHRSGGWERCEQKMMGITELPYHACQAVKCDKCIAIGDQLDSNNTFE